MRKNPTIKEEGRINWKKRFIWKDYLLEKFHTTTVGKFGQSDRSACLTIKLQLTIV